MEWNVTAKIVLIDPLSNDSVCLVVEYTQIELTNFSITDTLFSLSDVLDN